MSQAFKSSLEAWYNKPLEGRYVAIYLDTLASKVTKVMRKNVQGKACYVALATIARNQDVYAYPATSLSYGPTFFEKYNTLDTR